MENSNHITLNEITPIIKRMPRYGKIIYALYKDPEFTSKQKLLLGAGLAYAVSPIDLVPGFIPVLGQLDNILVALYTLKKVISQLPEEKRSEILGRFSLSLQELEEDLEITQQVTKVIAKKGLRYTGKGVYVVGRTAFSLVGMGGKKLYSLLNSKEEKS